MNFPSTSTRRGFMAGALAGSAALFAPGAFAAIPRAPLKLPPVWHAARQCVLAGKLGALRWSQAHCASSRSAHLFQSLVPMFYAFGSLPPAHISTFGSAEALLVELRFDGGHTLILDRAATTRYPILRGTHASLELREHSLRFLPETGEAQELHAPTPDWDTILRGALNEAARDAGAMTQYILEGRKAFP